MSGAPRRPLFWCNTKPPRWCTTPAIFPRTTQASRNPVGALSKCPAAICSRQLGHPGAHPSVPPRGRSGIVCTPLLGRNPYGCCQQMSCDFRAASSVILCVPRCAPPCGGCGIACTASPSPSSTPLLGATLLVQSANARLRFAPASSVILCAPPRVLPCGVFLQLLVSQIKAALRIIKFQQPTQSRYKMESILILS